MSGLPDIYIHGLRAAVFKNHTLHTYEAATLFNAQDPKKLFNRELVIIRYIYIYIYINDHVT